MEIIKRQSGPEMRIGKNAQREAGIKNPIPVNIDEMLRLEAMSDAHFDEYERMWENGEPAYARGKVAIKAMAEKRVATWIGNFLKDNGMFLRD